MVNQKGEMTEKITCPRRMNESGPWKNEPGLDSWEEDGTCSFCGGLGPSKAFALIKEGATVEPTDKKYKVYLNPGYRKVYLQHFTAEQVTELRGLTKR